MYIVIGLEVFGYAEIKGVHACKKTALNQANYLQANKKPHVCQDYKVVTKTDAKKQKLKFY